MSSIRQWIHEDSLTRRNDNSSDHANIPVLRHANERVGDPSEKRMLIALVEENEYLKIELLAARAELARFSEHRHSIGSVVLSSPTQIRSTVQRAIQTNSPSQRLKISASPRSLDGTNRTSTKNNQHPSNDALLGSFSVDKVCGSLGSKAVVGGHESAQGLKHRRNSNSPFWHPAGEPSPIVTHYRNAAQRLVLAKQNHGVSGRLRKDSDREMDPDIESSTNGDLVRVPSTPDTLDVSACSVESSRKTEWPVLEQDNALPLSFLAAIQDRAAWLVGLLVLQSMSSFIISRNERLLQKHLVIVRFLTMLVGAGGNAGNQASVGVIRGLAMGAISDRNAWITVIRELRMAVGLSAVMGVAGAFRVAIFLTPLTETVAITVCLVSVVFISVLLGTLLPLLMNFLNIDPAHSSTTIQVIMDILGVLITVRKFDW